MATDGGPAYPCIEKFECEHSTCGECADAESESGVPCRNETVFHPGLCKLEVFAMASTIEGIDWVVWHDEGSSGEDKWRKRAALEAKIKFIKAEAMLAESERRNSE